jgi:hypothetical protein
MPGPERLNREVHLNRGGRLLSTWTLALALELLSDSQDVRRQVRIAISQVR